METSENGDIPSRDGMEAPLSVEVAETRWERLRGLIGRRLKPGEALLLPSTRSIHTFGMVQAIDLVWIGPDREVVRVDKSVGPCRLRVCLRARSVVECLPGESQTVRARL